MRDVFWSRYLILCVTLISHIIICVYNYQKLHCEIVIWSHCDIGNRITFLDFILRGIHDVRVKVSREIGERSDALRACALMHATKICAGRQARRHSPIHRRESGLDGGWCHVGIISKVSYTVSDTCVVTYDVLWDTRKHDCRVNTKSFHVPWHYDDYVMLFNPFFTNLKMT